MIRYETYDPLSVVRFTHEDAMYMSQHYGLRFWYDNKVGYYLDGPYSVSPPDRVAKARIDKLIRDAEEGQPYAVKILRTITKAKLTGHL